MGTVSLATGDREDEHHCRLLFPKFFERRRRATITRDRGTDRTPMFARLQSLFALGEGVYHPAIDPGHNATCARERATTTEILLRLLAEDHRLST